MAEAASEQRRILDLLASGQLTVDEAAELLEALKGAASPFEPPAPPGPPRPRGLVVNGDGASARQVLSRSRGLARMLSIRIETDSDDGGEQSKISVNVPLGLAKFAGKLLPADAKSHLERQGVDLQELLEALDGDVSEGRLIDIEAKQDDGGYKAKIVIEVI